jgi:hypothetical protein
MLTPRITHNCASRKGSAEPKVPCLLSRLAGILWKFKMIGHGDMSLKSIHLNRLLRALPKVPQFQSAIYLLTHF